MIRIELTPEEVVEVLRVLEGYLSDLRYEISDTSSSNFKEQLRTEKRVVLEALEKFRAVVAVTSS